jgi:hypothetical protein
LPVSERFTPRAAKRPTGPFGDRFWRVVALFALCFLVYYFSYDHGRSSAKARLEREIAENKALRVQLGLQSQEIEDLKKSLFNAGKETGERADPANAPEPIKFAARVAEDKRFFDGRLVLTVVEVNNLDREIAVRLHFVDTAYRETTLIKVGQPLIFVMDDRENRFFLDQLKGSVAFFSFYENQAKDQ